MRGDPESPHGQASYRAARRAFIAACEKAHVETVARLHPAKAPDGKPLFMDCAAMGPRDAAKAVLVAGYDAKSSETMIALLSRKLPAGAKLVLVHALDPAAFAGIAGDPAWPAAMLKAVAVEELSRVRHLGLLPLGRQDETLKTLLQAQLPAAVLAMLPQAATAAKAWREIESFFAAY